eukprot:417903-Rhodomonas_salina.1
MIKKEIDPSRDCNIYNPSLILKTNIEDYDDAFWQLRFENNDVFINITDEKVQGLQKLMGSKWQDVYYNPCKSKEE